MSASTTGSWAAWNSCAGWRRPTCSSRRIRTRTRSSAGRSLMRWAQAGRSYRRRTPMPPRCWPAAMACSCPGNPMRGQPHSTTCSRMTSSELASGVGRTASPAAWCGLRSPRNIAHYSAESPPGRAAYQLSRRWPRSMPESEAPSAQTTAPLPPAVRVHLEALSDNVGILQHAAGRIGDPRHGYCTDDVARALELDLMQARKCGWSAVGGRARRNLRFLQAAYQPEERWFRNFRAVDGTWRDEVASDDSQGRALLALGSVLATCPDKKMVTQARTLLLHALPGIERIRSPRAAASCILALDLAYGSG